MYIYIYVLHYCIYIYYTIVYIYYLTITQSTSHDFIYFTWHTYATYQCPMPQVLPLQYDQQMARWLPWLPLQAASSMEKSTIFSWENHLISTRWCPSSLAKLVYNSNVTMVFVGDISIVNGVYPEGTIIIQRPFQDPKLEVPTIYKAYFLGLFQGISLQNMAKNIQKYGTNVPPF